MTHLIQQLKAQSKNAEVVTDYNGKNAEMTIRMNGTINYIKFENIADFIELAEELNDVARKLTNEINAQDIDYKE